MFIHSILCQKYSKPRGQEYRWYVQGVLDSFQRGSIEVMWIYLSKQRGDMICLVLLYNISKPWQQFYSQKRLLLTGRNKKTWYNPYLAIAICLSSTRMGSKGFTSFLEIWSLFCWGNYHRIIPRSLHSPIRQQDLQNLSTDVCFK